jgi:hypothetical protein
MILGMTTFTFVHVVLSLIGIFSGFVVVFGLLAGKRLDGWTALFLVSTVATSVTGFLFPFHRFLPSHGVGILSLLVLAIAILARYPLHLAGAWRRIYTVTAVISLYLNVFVLIAQAFQKVLESDGSDAVRAAIFGHASCRSGGFRHAWHCRSDQVPQRAGPDGLIGYISRVPSPVFTFSGKA